jgi:hypothetical protein
LKKGLVTFAKIFNEPKEEIAESGCC